MCAHWWLLAWRSTRDATTRLGRLAFRLTCCRPPHMRCRRLVARDVKWLLQQKYHLFWSQV